MNLNDYGLCQIYFKITFYLFLDDEAVKHQLLRCVLEIVFNKHSSAASHSSRLPEDLETCSSIPSLASSFIVDSDVSPISVAEDPRSAGQGILTSTPSSLKQTSIVTLS